MSLPDRAVLATMHGKEAAIAPPLARLGIALTVPASFDTDQFGTFAGDVPRAGSMIEAARAKARAASDLTGLPIAIASEGAYGPHPMIPFLAQGQELLLWRDSRNGHEIVETLIDNTPTFDHAEVADIDEAETFLKRIDFPKTALLVASAATPTKPVARGVRDRDALSRAIGSLTGSGPALLTTDMRAHMNPRRMAKIAELADRLATRLASPCPHCAAPGWGFLRADPGLPCSACGTPTPMARGEIHGCTACGASAPQPRLDGRMAADPGHCVLCNP